MRGAGREPGQRRGRAGFLAGAVLLASLTGCAAASSSAPQPSRTLIERCSTERGHTYCYGDFATPEESPRR